MLYLNLIGEIATNGRELDTENDGFGWGFGFFCLFLDIVFGILFWILLRNEDKELPHNQRVMDFCMNVLYWIVCCFTSWLGSLCFYVIARHEINQRKRRIKAPVFNNVPIQQNQGMPIAEAFPVNQISKT